MEAIDGDITWKRKVRVGRRACREFLPLLFPSRLVPPDEGSTVVELATNRYLGPQFEEVGRDAKVVERGQTLDPQSPIVRLAYGPASAG